MTGPWRLGNRNPNNLYFGDQHVGMVIDPGRAKAIVAAMNGDAERVAGAVRDLTVELQALADRTGDAGVREALGVVRAYAARNSLTSPVGPERAGPDTSPSGVF